MSPTQPTPAPATARLPHIAIQVDRRGRRIAFRVERDRSFRMPLAAAEVLLATGQAVEDKTWAQVARALLR